MTSNAPLPSRPIRTRRCPGKFYSESPDPLRWMTCPLQDFMEHLRRVEQAKGIVWRRDDAYSVESRGKEATS